MALDFHYPIANLSANSSKGYQQLTPSQPVTLPLHSQPEFSEHVKKYHFDYLSKYFPSHLVFTLDQKLQQKVFHDLQTRPLYLTVFDPYRLGRLTYIQYCHALKQGRPNVHTFPKNTVLRLVQLIDLANQYYLSGYRLSIMDQVEENPGLRMTLFNAMRELHILFTPTSQRLYWPQMEFVRQELMQCLSTGLPQVQRQHLPLPPDADFERMLHTPGSWIVEFGFTVSQTTLRYQQIMSLLVEEYYTVINLKFPPSTGTALMTIKDHPRICFIGCNPVSLVFWLTFFKAVREKQHPLKSVVFCFDTCFEEFEFLDVLKKLALPIYKVDPLVIFPTFVPDYSPENGLTAPVFAHPIYYTPACIHPVSGSGLNQNQDLPICWVSDTDYEEVLSWFSDMMQSSPCTGFVTNTQQEADTIWQDYITRYHSGRPFFPNMACTLVNDPVRPPLWIQEEGVNVSTWSLMELANQERLGNNFLEEEIEQLQVTAFHRTTFRIYSRIVYYSSTPISKQRLLTLASYTLYQVIVLASKENMKELTN
jgi:hypothetical protein